MTTLELLESLSKKLFDTPFDADALADKLVFDGGLDIEPLTKDDLLALMADCFKGEWKNVVFSFSELQCYYGASELDKRNVIAWCATALIFGQACRAHEADWESHLHCFTIGLRKVAAHLNSVDFAAVLAQALSPFDDMFDAQGNEKFV